MISIRQHFLISGLMMAALVPFPVLAQNAGTVNAASGGSTAGAPGTGAATQGNAAGTNSTGGPSAANRNPNKAGYATGANTANTAGTKGNATGGAVNQATETPRPGDIRIIPAQQLINRPLIDPNGHDAGRIDRVVLNTANGAIDFVIVAGNGNFNLQGKVLALPWRAIVAPIPANGAIKNAQGMANAREGFGGYENHRLPIAR